MDVSVLVGARLREARKAAQLTQDEVAKRAGLSTRSLASIEHGTASPSLITLDALATALGLSLAHVLIRDEIDHAVLLAMAGHSMPERRRILAVVQVLASHAAV